MALSVPRIEMAFPLCNAIDSHCRLSYVPHDPRDPLPQVPHKFLCLRSPCPQSLARERDEHVCGRDGSVLDGFGCLSRCMLQQRLHFQIAKQYRFTLITLKTEKKIIEYSFDYYSAYVVRKLLHVIGSGL